MDKNIEDITLYYDSISSGYNELHASEQTRKLEIIRNELNVKKTDFLLDVGCGTCLSFYFFDCNLFGIEPAEEMLKQYKNNNVREKVFVCSAENMNKYLSRNLFDFIICVSVAHHFDDVKKVFENIRNVSKENAKIVFSLLKKTSNFNLLKEEIYSNFNVFKQVDEGKDLILFCEFSR